VATIKYVNIVNPLRTDRTSVPTDEHPYASGTRGNAGGAAASGGDVQRGLASFSRYFKRMLPAAGVKSGTTG
jgi:hypothetical protein